MFSFVPVFNANFIIYEDLNGEIQNKFSGTIRSTHARISIVCLSGRNCLDSGTKLRNFVDPPEFEAFRNELARIYSVCNYIIARGALPVHPID